MEACKTWVRRKKDYVRPLESLANGLTWLLPERFSTSEIGPEAGFVKHCNCNFGHTYSYQRPYNQYCLYEWHTDSAHPSSFHYCLCISALRTWILWLKLLQSTTMVIRNGFLLLLQKLSIKKHSLSDVYNMNCGFPKAWRPSWTLLVKKQSWSKPIESSRKGISVLSRFVESARMISDPVCRQRIKQQHAIMEPPKKGVNEGLIVLGEILSITGLLIYALFIRRHGIRSWIHWFLSLAVDFMGIGFLSHVTNSRKGGKEQQFHLFASEKNEVKRRKLLWALYLMRELFFNKYPRHKLESTYWRLFHWLEL